MRDLKHSEKNSIAIFDKLSGSGLVIYYRTPTTKERIKYSSEQAQNLNTANFENVFETQIGWAEKLITGFSNNSFGYDEKPVSSDKESEHYQPDWMKMLKETSSDLLMLFTESVMGKTAFVVKMGGVSEDFFTKSSGNGTEPGQKKSETTT